MSCFAFENAYANPTGPAVVNGQVNFSRQGNVLNVTNSPGAIINWQSFSIGATETTRFIQQSAASSVLNRVVGRDPSVLLGTLQSNGRVFLINPTGILIGQGARIDVGSLVASTLNITDQNYLAGRLNFSSEGLTAPGGAIQNFGNITTPAGGKVYLVAPNIENHGVITTPGGEVLLAAGNSVRLTDTGTPNVFVEITAPDNQALNLGRIIADSGRIGISAGLINQKGIVRADSAVLGKNGTIVLKATQDVTLDAESVTTTNGPSGGSVTVQSGSGTTLVSGNVEATGSAATGGTVQLLGNHVGLIDQARVNVSGATGGGTVLVGGDYQGRNPDIQNAAATYVGGNVRISADAIESGAGGRVIVWSDAATRFYGAASARGGARSGDGGLVETSGKQWLDFRGAVDTSAPRGAMGTLLLDPKNLDANDSEGAAYANPGNALFTDNPGGASIVLASGPGSISEQTSNVVLETNNDLTFTSPVNITNAGTTLTARAGRSILVNANITTNNADVRLTANETTANGVSGSNRDAGAASLSMAAGTTINAGTGNIFLRMNDGTGHAGTSGNIVVENLSANNVSILHDGLTSGSSILRTSASSLITGAGSVFIELENASGATASIGTSGNPIRVNTPVLEAHYHNASGGIFIDSPDVMDLQIGGVPEAIFSGLVRGVQAVSGGPVSIGVNGTLSQLAGNAGCGLTGGTGGPICATPSSSITLTAGSMNFFAPITAGSGGINFTATGNLSVQDATVSTSGAMTVNANGVSLAANTASALLSSAGTQAITVDSGGLTLTGAGAGAAGKSAQITQTDTTATQTITVNGGGNLQLNGGAGSGNNNFARISASGTAQNITFNSGGNLTLTGGTVGNNNFAQIRANNATLGAQTQTISGATGITLTGGASGGGVDINNNELGNYALIRNSNGSQSISVGAGGITLTGGGGPLTDNKALIIQGTAPTGSAGTSQTITINNGGAITLDGGSSAQSNVIGGTGNPSNFFRGSYALIESDGDSQLIAFTGGGAISLTGGTVGSNNAAEIFSRIGTQTITGAPNITLTGGASGGTQNGTVNEGNYALILANVGAQNITAGAINITGGANGTNNSARVATSGASALQTISATGITLTGGADGASTNVNATGNHAYIRSAGSQSITVDSGGLSVIGGSGASFGNYANVRSAGLAGASQTITVNNGGSITVQGGSSTGTNVGVDANGNGNGSFANITADGDTQQINFTAGGAINITGGTVGSRNSASIRLPTTTGTHTQTITGAPSITLTGGVSGGFTDEGNSANINVDSGSQNITAGAILLNGGAAGIENSASIRSPLQMITASTVTLNGGSGSAGLGGARIGGGAGVPSATNLTLTTTGDITLTGGSASGAIMGGSATITTARDVDVTINGGGNVTLNGGTGAEARIGSPGSLVQAGNLSITAAGNIALNDGPGFGGSIRTLGNVTLHADSAGKSISEQSAGLIQANTLTATANSGITLTSANNVVNSFNGSITNVGNISLTNTASPLTITGISANNPASSVTVANTGDLTIDSGAGNFSTGPLTLSSTGNINIQDSQVQSNFGAMNVTAGGNFNVTSTGLPTTLAAAGGGGLSISAANATFSGGTATINGGYSVAGTTTISGGTVNFNTATTASVPTLTMTGGTLQGTGDVSVSGAFNWSEGTIQGSGTLNTSGTTTLNPASNVALWGTRVWSNTGTVNQSGAGYLDMGSGTPTVTNQAGGTWNEGSTNTIQVMSNGTFNNAGIFNKTGTNTAQIAGTVFNNTASGTNAVNVNAGTLQLNTGTSSTDSGNYVIDSGATLEFLGGTRNLNSGANFSGAGNLLFSGASVNVNSGAVITALNNVTITGGVVNQNTGSTFAPVALVMTDGTLEGSGDVSVSGAFNWSAGTIQGSGTLNTSGTTTLNPSVATSLAGTRVWNNTGTVNQSGAGKLDMGSGTPTVNNRAGGAWNEGSTNENYVIYGGTFNNAGNFDKTGTNTAPIDGTVFNNTGIVNVSGGTLQVNTALTNNGTIRIASGSTFKPTGETFNNGTTGIVSGTGTLDVSGTMFTNDGTLKPAGSNAVGTLNITGDAALGASSVLEAEINGTGAGNYDQLAVSGNIDFAAGNTLNLVTLASYVPAVNDSFPNVVTYGSRSGTFTNINPSFGGIVTPTYTGTNLSLLLTALTGSTNIWLFDGSDSWLNAARWSQGHAPTTLEEVIIPDYATQFTVSIPSGAQVAKSIVVQGNDIFAVDGGSFTFTNASTLNSGTLNVAGGTVTANGNLTAKNLNLSAGTLGGTGDLTVTTNFSQTGGSINRTGTMNVTQASGDLSFSAAQVGDLNLRAAGGNLILGAINAGLLDGRATQGVSVRNAISASGPVSLTAGWNGVATNPAGVVAGGGNIDFLGAPALITAYGRPITLLAGGAVTLTPDAGNVTNGAITTSAQSASSFAGDIDIRASGGAISLGTLSAVNESGASGAAPSGYGGNVNVAASNGSIAVNSDVSASAGITIQASGELTQSAGAISNVGSPPAAGANDVRLSGNNVTLGSVASQRDLFVTASGALSITNATVFGVQQFDVDDNYFSYTLPFAFNFYGTPYTTAYISSNGVITFGSGTSTYTDSTSSLASHRIVAPAWNDWVTFGSNPNGTPHDVFITNAAGGLTVRWDVGRWSNESQVAQFEAMLGRSGNITFNYGPANSSFAGDVTIGLANQSAASRVVSQLMSTPGFSLNRLNSTTFTYNTGSGTYTEAVSGTSNWSGSGAVGGAAGGALSALRSAAFTAGTSIALNGSLTAPAVTLTAQNGAISQGAPIVASSLVTQSATGTSLTDTGNTIGNVGATNSGSGDITLTNGAALNLAGISQAGGGGVAVNNSNGTLTVSGGINGGGTVTLQTSGSSGSHIVVGAPVTAGGAVIINATPSAGNVSIQDASVIAGGAVSISGTDLNVTSTEGSALLKGASMSVALTGAMSVHAGANGSAEVKADNGQSITARSLDIRSGAGGVALVRNNNSADNSSNQTITINGTGSGEAIHVESLGGSFAALSNLSSGLQSITVNNAGAVNVLGTSGGPGIGASIDSGGGQSILVQGASSLNQINVGSAGAAGPSFIIGNNQVITAGASGQSGSITIVGGAADGADAFIRNLSGTQTVSAAGAISITGGSQPNTVAASGAWGYIYNEGTGLQSINAGTISLQGGSNGSSNGAYIASDFSSQDVTVGGDLRLTGGSGTGASVLMFGDPDVNLTVGGNINLTRGTGEGAFARIQAGSPTSIIISFTNPSSNIVVDGSPFDPATSTGTSGLFVGPQNAPVAASAANLQVSGGAYSPSPPPSPSVDPVVQTVNNTSIQATPSASTAASQTIGTPPTDTLAATTTEGSVSGGEKKDEKAQDQKQAATGQPSASKTSKPKPQLCN